MDYVDIGFRSGDLCNSKSMGSFRKRDNKHIFSKNAQEHSVFGGLVAFHFHYRVTCSERISRSLDVEDDIYFYAVDLLNGLGFEGSHDENLKLIQELFESNRFLEVTIAQLPRGEKAVAPMRLLLGENM